MRIHQSAEDYLEMILRLTEQKGYARAIDIAEGLSVSKPSVSIAMRNLRENGFITVDANNHIALTEAGLDIAERIYARHRLLKRALMNIGVSEATAEADACRIEHDISDETEAHIRDRLACAGAPETGGCLNG